MEPKNDEKYVKSETGSITQGELKETNNESQKIRRTVRFKSEDETYSANVTPIPSPNSGALLHQNEPKIVIFIC